MPYPYYQNYGNYNPMYYQQPQPQQHNQQIQNGGFVSAPSMDYARSYPVAPGNSVTFKIESQPYICTKTLGFSQLDQPIFELANWATWARRYTRDARATTRCWWT